MPVFKHGGRCVLFVHIPKTGGTSIEKFFKVRKVKVGLSSQALHGPGRHGFPCSPQHFHIEVLAEMFPAGFFDARLAVVRHPVDRVLSEYRHRMGILIRNGKSTPSFEKWLRAGFRRVSKDPYFKDNHFRPQTGFLDRQTEVYRFENGLERPIDRLAELLGIDASMDKPVPIKNAGPEIDAEVTPECLAMIDEFYAEDFAQLDYTLDASNAVYG